ncbi:effector-associated constant component EACC1 [Nonomuraea candida]|uniref:effector-associated constant component EACC1 n=1 Tax=Nonomuraea candida TaxID=359159 RepID=UPI0006947928|nr:hypothetical protein [Nonomuraea candida]
MQVELRVVADADPTGELISLTKWLQSQRALRGRVRPVRRPPGPEELGGAIELLGIALGSGGAGVVLARALTTWLTNRHSDVSITVTTSEGTVQVEAKRVDDALPLLREVLNQGRVDDDG